MFAGFSYYAAKNLREYDCLEECGHFDINSGPFLTYSQLCTTPHAACATHYFLPMLMGC